MGNEDFYIVEKLPRPLHDPTSAPMRDIEWTFLIRPSVARLPLISGSPIFQADVTFSRMAHELHTPQ